MKHVDGVVLERAEILLADYLVRQGVEYLQRRNGGTVPARALQLRDRLAAFASRETVAVVVSDPCESKAEAEAVIVEGSRPAGMTTAQAAAGLGLSPQAVRGLCRSGELLAARGQAGQWVIDPGSAAAAAARRRGEA